MEDKSLQVRLADIELDLLAAIYRFEEMGGPYQWPEAATPTEQALAALDSDREALGPVPVLRAVKNIEGYAESLREWAETLYAMLGRIV